MPLEPLQSPWTGDHWDDARPAIGTLAGLATALNERRPRRRPPPSVTQAIADAVSAAGILAGLPKISVTGIEGTQASDAYWKAKEAKISLTPLVGNNFVLNCYYVRSASEDWLIHEPDNAFSVIQQTAIRLAYLAAAFTEKASASYHDIVDDYVKPGLRCAAILVEQCNMQRDEAGSIERVWQFACAAGRMPTEADADLLAAFEAALIADCGDFARHLARHGYGVATK